MAQSNQLNKEEYKSNDQWQRRNPLVVPSLDWLKSFLSDHLGETTFVEIKKMGGLVNSNFKVTCDHGNFFFRIYTGKSEAHAKELSIIRRVEQTIRTPKVLVEGQYAGNEVVLFEWLEGQTLSSRIQHFRSESAESCGQSIGACLSDFHHFGFQGNGFIGSDGAIEHRFTMDSVVFTSYVMAGLQATSSCIPDHTANKVWRFVDSNAALMDGWPSEGCLVHGDFHPENILVDDNFNLVGIVDWESCMAWQPVHDIAHLLRRSMKFRDAFERGLLHGYRENGGWIPEQWESSLKLLQLLSWVDKLANGEQRIGVIKTANSAIEKIVA